MSMNFSVPTTPGVTSETAISGQCTRQGLRCNTSLMLYSFSIQAVCLLKFVVSTAALDLLSEAFFSGVIHRSGGPLLHSINPSLL
jgi:hypothetical protein